MKIAEPQTTEDELCSACGHPNICQRCEIDEMEAYGKKALERGGLGTEGWLGVMIFLGIVLGLVYARLTLP